MIGIIVNNEYKFWYSTIVGFSPNIYPTNKDIKISGVNPTTDIIPTKVPVNCNGVFVSSIIAKYKPLKA